MNNDVSAVKYGNYIIRRRLIGGVYYYDVYNLDGTLYNGNLLDLSSIGVNERNIFDIDYNNVSLPSNNYSSGTGGGGGNNNFNNSNDNITENFAKNLNNKLGSLFDTNEEIRKCEAKLEQAKIAENGIINSTKLIESAASKGLGTEACVSYYSLLSSAISTISANQETTKDAAKCLNNLNKCTKELLNNYAGKHACEERIATLKANEVVFTSWRDADGTYHDNQSEVDAWKKEYDSVCNLLEQINKEIDKLKGNCDSIYRDICSKYGNILSLDGYDDVQKTSTSNNSTISSINLSDYTFENKSFVASNGTSVDYYLYVPKTDQKKLPVHLYLGGSGETDGKELTRGLTESIYSGSYTPNGIVIMPRVYSTGSSEWNYDANTGNSTPYHDALIELVDDVVDKYDGDRNRISLSGVSRGSEAAYVLLGNNPNYFSSYVAVSGSPVWLKRNKDQWSSLSNTNVLVIHSSNDTYLDYNENGPNRVNGVLKDLNLSNDNVHSVTLNGNHNIDYHVFKENLNIDGYSQNPIDWAMSQEKV